MGLTMRGGFIGTGIMGGHMVRRLSEAGFDMAAWNRSPGKTASLKDLGIEVASSAVGAATAKDFVICMLSSGPVCDEVLLGEGGVIDAMQTNKGFNFPVDNEFFHCWRVWKHGLCPVTNCRELFECDECFSHIFLIVPPRVNSLGCV